jgi:hypothetical protein
MVFGRNPESGDVDYSELDVDHYNDEVDAYSGHETMIQKWEAEN